jgi:hypothetical protein
MAKIALLYSSVFGNDAYESLLSFMRTEKNDTLDEVTADFMEICTKLTPPVDLFCAWEQNPTAASYSERVSSKVPGLLKQEFFKAGARKFMETGFSAFGSGTVSSVQYSQLRAALTYCTAFRRKRICRAARGTLCWFDRRS